MTATMGDALVVGVGTPVADAVAQHLIAAGRRVHTATIGGFAPSTPTSAPMLGSVRDRDSASAVVEAAGQELCTVIVVVDPPPHAAATHDAITDDDVRALLDRAFTLPFWVAQACARRMQRVAGAALVFVFPGAGEYGEPEHAAWAASIGGMPPLVKSLARELGNVGVRVNGVSFDALEEATAPAAGLRSLFELPLKRHGKASEVAAVAGWLTSPEASYVTGAIVRVNGGFYL